MSVATIPSCVRIHKNCMMREFLQTDIFCKLWHVGCGDTADYNGGGTVL